MVSTLVLSVLPRMAGEHDAIDLCRAPLFLQATRHLIELVSSCADVVVDDHPLACDAFGVFQLQSFSVLFGGLLLYL